MQRQRVLLASLVIGTLLIACTPAAQSGSTATPLSSSTPTAMGTGVALERDVPEGWQRLQVRQGFVGRGFENPLVGFTINLPRGWSAGEGWPGRDGPRGWIAGPAPSASENVPTLRFEVGGGFGYSVDALKQDSRYVVTQPVVAEESAIMHLAAADAVDKGPQVGIYYARIPGGRAGADVPSLAIEGDSRGFTDQALLARVLTSVRYAEITRLPDIPAPKVAPGPDWQQMAAHSDYPSFMIMTPPGWKTTNLQGIDTLVGRIEGDGITLTYDFGGHAGVPYDPDSAVREHRQDPPHLLWEEKVEENLFWFVRPVAPESNPYGVTGAYVFLPRGDSGRETILSVAAYDLQEEQQETVLAMLRTITLQPR